VAQECTVYGAKDAILPAQNG